MMIKERFRSSVYIADFTAYNNTAGNQPTPFHGVVIREKDNGVIPSFLLANENGVSFSVVNNEKNSAFYIRPDGRKVPQCECIVHSERKDNGKCWAAFLELKYCKAKNRFQNMLDGISQLEATCKYVFDEKHEFEGKRFKKYLVISTPGVEPLDPFDAYYFDQDYVLSVRERTGAFLKSANSGRIRTTALVDF